MPDLPLRQAALTAGLGMLGMTLLAPYADLVVLPEILIPGDAGRTAENIRENRLLFVSGALGYLGAFVCDVVVAWALYLLLSPFNRSLALLTAWFRLMYTAIAFVGALKLFTAFRMITEPQPRDSLGVGTLEAQAQLALDTFGTEWGIGLLIFGFHLLLLGYLVYRSGFLPAILGALLVIAGAGYVIDALGPYLYPDLDLRVATFTFVGELIFMLWLLIRGRRLTGSVTDGTATVG